MNLRCYQEFRGATDCEGSIESHSFDCKAIPGQKEWGISFCEEHARQAKAHFADLDYKAGFRSELEIKAELEQDAYEVAGDYVRKHSLKHLKLAERIREVAKRHADRIKVNK